MKDQHSSSRSLVVLIACLAFQAIALGWNAFRNSPTIDEPGHLQSGLAIHALGRYEVYAVNPPLIRSIAAVPGRLAGLDPVISDARFDPASRWEFAAGAQLFAKASHLAMEALIWGRLILIPIVLGGTILIWKWSAQAFGHWAAGIATVLWAFSPMVLGHGALITPDVSAAVIGAWSLYRFRIWLGARTFWNAHWWGISTAAALLTKFTWLAILPPTFAIVFLLCHWRIDRRAGSLAQDVLQASWACGLALFLINACYGFDRSFTALGDIPLVSQSWRADETATDELPETGAAPMPNRFSGTWFGSIPVPLPICFVQGIDVQKRDFDSGEMSPSFLAGQWQDHGWWYYYLFALVIKEPLPLLVLSLIAAGGVVLAIRERVKVSKQNKACATRPHNGHRSSVNACLIAIPPLLILTLVSSQTGFNHHYRYLLPAYPLVFIGLSGGLSTFAQSHFRWPRFLVVACSVWLIGTTIAAAPYWLSYFNTAVGGTAGGEAYLSDSNIDWGQDLLRLRGWQEAHPNAEPLYVVAFTFISPSHLGIDTESADFLFEPASAANEFVAKSELRPGWYAVSTAVQQGRHFWLVDEAGRMQRVTSGMKRFASLKPTYQVGSTIEVFRIRGEFENKN